MATRKLPASTDYTQVFLIKRQIALEIANIVWFQKISVQNTRAIALMQLKLCKFLK